MKRGFTLLELMVVIIIVGVLATLGVMQYQGVIERSRGAEAKQVIGALRSMCAGFFMRDVETLLCDADNLGIGADIPGPVVGTDCESSHYFTYAISATGLGLDTATFTATRCIDAGLGDGGKAPDSTSATRGTVVLTTDFGAGTDVWTSTGGF